MFLSKWVAGLLLAVVILDQCILSVVRNVFVLFDCWALLGTVIRSFIIEIGIHLFLDL